MGAIRKLCRVIFATLMLGLSCPSFSQSCPSTPTGVRFSIIGPEVTDVANGLVWSRCSVGQRWVEGVCAGSATLMTHEQALQHAANLRGWRLPNVKELSSLTDKRCINPAIDATAFPNMSLYGLPYWSSTPLRHSGGAVSAYSVSLIDGVILDYDTRNNLLSVLLVRTAE